MTAAELGAIYRGYIDCLNRQDWARLGTFVHSDVSRNEQRLGLAGYRKMLENDFDAIPDLQFSIEAIVTEPPVVASRLCFDCHPRATLFGLPINGQSVQFGENVFYRFVEGRIHDVWSIIDTQAIAAQLENKNAGH